MATDHEHGLFAWDRQLLSTGDGGRSWTPVVLPGASSAEIDHPLITSRYAFVLTVGSCHDATCRDTLWRAPAGTQRWSRIGLPPGFRYGDDLTAQGDGLLAVSKVDRRPMHLSTDDGASWTAIALPRHCSGQAGTNLLAATCSRGDWADSWLEVLRNGTWRTVYDAGSGADAALDRVVAVTNRIFLVAGSQKVLRVQAGKASRIHGGFAAAWDAAGFIDGRVGYVLTVGRLHRSSDGGHTWTLLGQ